MLNESKWFALTIVASLTLAACQQTEPERNLNEKQVIELQNQVISLQSEVGRLKEALNQARLTEGSEPEVGAGEQQDEQASNENMLPDAELINEEAVGYIKQIYTHQGTNFIEIDYIQWLNPEECQAKGIDASHGYCIVNENTRLRTFEVVPDADISIFAFDENGQFSEPMPLDFSALKSYLSPEESDYSVLAYDVVVIGGKITTVSQRQTY